MRVSQGLKRFLDRVETRRAKKEAALNLDPFFSRASTTRVIPQRCRLRLLKKRKDPETM